MSSCAKEVLLNQPGCERSQQDLEQIELTAGMVACKACIKSIFENQQEKIQQLETEANTDFVTGLPNKRSLSASFEESVESGKPFGIINIDLVKFKQVNDKLGHKEGDMALSVFAECLNQLRPTDIPVYLNDPEKYADTPSRIGGDEFAALIDLSPREEPHEENDMTMEERLTLIGDRIAVAFSEHPFVVDFNESQPEDLKLGMRFGLAVYEEGMSFDQLLSQSDPKNK